MAEAAQRIRYRVGQYGVVFHYQYAHGAVLRAVLLPGYCTGKGERQAPRPCAVAAPGARCLRSTGANPEVESVRLECHRPASVHAVRMFLLSRPPGLTEAERV
jgi:hypothetical protein